VDFVINNGVRFDRVAFVFDDWVRVDRTASAFVSERFVSSSALGLPITFDLRIRVDLVAVVFEDRVRFDLVPLLLDERVRFDLVDILFDRFDLALDRFRFD